MKVGVEHFVCNNILQDFKFMKKKSVEIAMDVWWNSKRKESIYKRKIQNSILSVLVSKISSAYSVEETGIQSNVESY